MTTIQEKKQSTHNWRVRTDHFRKFELRDELKKYRGDYNLTIEGDYLTDTVTGEILIDYKKGAQYTRSFSRPELHNDHLIDTATDNLIFDFKSCTKKPNSKKQKVNTLITTPSKHYTEAISIPEMHKLCPGKFDNERAKVEINHELIDDLHLKQQKLSNAEVAQLKILCNMIQRRNMFILPKKTVESCLSNKTVKLSRTLNRLRDKNCLWYQSTKLHEKGMIKVVINPAYAWKGDYEQGKMEKLNWMNAAKSYDLYADTRRVIESNIFYILANADYGTWKFAKMREAEFTN